MKIKRILSCLSSLLLLPLASADVITPGFRSSSIKKGQTLFSAIGLPLIINLIVNSALIAISIFVFKKFRTKAKVNYVWRVLVITLIGLIIDTIVFFIGTGGIMTLIQGVVVLVLVGITSYLLVFKKTLEAKQAIICSVIFGIISNPVWLTLL